MKIGKTFTTQRPALAHARPEQLQKTQTHCPCFEQSTFFCFYPLTPSQPEQKKPRNAKSKPKPGEKKIISIPAQSRSIETQDAEYFSGSEIGDFSFLHHLNEKELGKRVEKEKLPREETSRNVKVPKSKVPAEREDSAEFSDEENLNEVFGDALDAEVKEHD